MAAFSPAAAAAAVQLDHDFPLSSPTTQQQHIKATHASSQHQQ